MTKEKLLEVAKGITGTLETPKDYEESSSPYTIKNEIEDFIQEFIDKFNYNTYSVLNEIQDLIGFDTVYFESYEDSQCIYAYVSLDVKVQGADRIVEAVFNWDVSFKKCETLEDVAKEISLYEVQALEISKQIIIDND